jgi:hypothetical protein
LITPVVQRWRERRDSYRPAGEPIRTSDYEVAMMRSDAEARAFVEAHHYSGSLPAARERIGLYRRGELVGVAVFSHPANDAVLKRLPCDRLEGVELGRFVLLDDVPANGESWALARCFELLRREGYRGVVSFSDPMPRTSAAGDVVFVGHYGGIYQSANAVYQGRATPRTLHLLPDGRVLSERAISKIRARERGWRYSAAILERFGAAPLVESDDSRAWLATWLPRLTRKQRHTGNLTYLFGLDRLTKKHLPRSLPYPKLDPTALPGVARRSAGSPRPSQLRLFVGVA